MLEQKIRSLIFVFSTDCLALKLNEIFLENPKNVTDQKSSNDFQISRH